MVYIIESTKGIGVGNIRYIWNEGKGEAEQGTLE